jgi:hypothetical protein
MPVATRALEVIESGDPREEIWNELRPYVESVRVLGPYLLVAVYDRGGKQLKSGLYLPQQTEDPYQGKTGLVLKLGEGVKPGIRGWDWSDEPIRVGDWVGFDVRTASPFLMGTRMCRLVQYDYVTCVVDRPDAIY